LKGRSHLDQRDQEGLTEAIEYFQRAVEKDPTYALAWAGMADAVSLFPLFGPDDRDRSGIDAEHAARRALELNPDLAEAHTSLGYLQGIPQGVQRLRHAVDLKPSYAQAHQWLGLKLLVDGKAEEAYEHASIAAELSPRNRSTQGLLAYQHIVDGRYQNGLAILEQETDSFEVEPDWGVEITSRFLFAALYSLGEWEKAQSLIQHRKNAVESPKWVVEWNAKQGMVEEALDENDRALQRAQDLRHEPGALYRGLLLLALGDTDGAFEAFYSVDTWGYYNVVELRYFYPALLDSLREQPRFDRLLDTVEQRRASSPTAAYRAHSG
jgi:tetratricopeptide (TPR) repeat protein